MKDKKLIVIVTGIVLLVLGVVGATYAWFQANVSGNTNASSVVVKSGTLSLEYINGQEVKGENILPGWSQEKEFTVENKGENDVYYKIEWENLTNTFVNKSDLTYTLTGTTNGSNQASNLIQTEVPNSGTNIAVLENIKISSGEKHTYRMNVSYANRNADQSSDTGKILTGKIAIKESTGLALPLLKDVVEAGDFVAYTPSEATWQTTTAIPSTQGTFGGWTAGQDKSTSVTCRSSYANEYALGWRVLSNDGETIKLISAGTPECYYHGQDSEASVALLTATSGANAAETKYGSNLSESVKYFDKTDLETWNGSTVAYGTEITNNLIKIGALYWLASSYDSDRLWLVLNDGRVNCNYDYGFGLRPLITLKSNIQVVSGSGESIANAYQITL